MEPLVRWLLGGFVVSLVFILVARWFWKRYDRPSEAALEWQREQEEKRKERKVWESVEMQMRREAEEAERKAAFQIKRSKLLNPLVLRLIQRWFQRHSNLLEHLFINLLLRRRILSGRSPTIRMLNTYLNLYKSDKTHWDGER